jgi:molybdopterin-guanine dinucleotide biosynthesis protein A
MTHTLVDCECKAIVHPDGSGVEVVDCDMPYAAPDLWEALETILNEVDYIAGYCSLTDPISGVLPRILISKARNAILKARGGYYDTPN